MATETIFIPREEVGFGFSPGVDSGNFMIKYVSHNGPAHRAGLRIGDTILKVNGDRQTALPQLVQSVKDAGDLLCLEVQRSPSKEPDSGAGVFVEIKPTQEISLDAALKKDSKISVDAIQFEVQSQLSDSTSILNPTKASADFTLHLLPPQAQPIWEKDGVRLFGIDLMRRQSGFGFAPFPKDLQNLRGEQDSKPNSNSNKIVTNCSFADFGLVIQHVVAGGEAYSKGMQAWDVIVEIQGESTEKQSLSACVSLIQSSSSLSLKLLRGPAPPPPPIEDRTDMTIAIFIEAGFDEAGFHVSEPNPMLHKAVAKWGKSPVVHSVTAGGVAKRSGLVNSDLILFANDLDLRSLSFVEAKKYLESQEGKLHLKVVRQSPQTLNAKGTFLVSINLRSEGGFGFSPHRYSIADAVPQLHHPTASDIASMDLALLSQFSLSPFTFAVEWGGGLPIIAVDSIGPAAMAGLLPGDVIINVNDFDVRSLPQPEVSNLLSKYPEVRVQVIRQQHSDVSTLHTNGLMRRISTMQIDIAPPSPHSHLPFFLFLLTFIAIIPGFFNLYLHWRSPYAERKWAVGGLAIIIFQICLIVILLSILLTR